MIFASIQLLFSQVPRTVQMVEAPAALGGRIRALRERVGLKAQDLAAQLELDPSAISNIENGKRAVKTDELAAIADALGVSVLALLDERSLLARLPIAPRTADGTVSTNTVARLTSLAELHEILAEDGIPGRATLNEVGAPEALPTQWLERASALAEWAREVLEVKCEGSERFSALTEAIEDRLHVDVLVDDWGEPDVAGASITDKSFPFIFINADQQTSRALFSLAHELAHVLLSDQQSMTVDTNLSGNTEDERVANAFAADFLMPEKVIKRIIAEHADSLESLAHMIDEFGVSLESLIYRLHNLGRINAAGRDQLQELGWRRLLNRVEASDPDLARRLLNRMGSKPERRPPTLLTHRTFLGFRKGIVSIRPLGALLRQDEQWLLDHLADVEENLEAVLAQDAMSSDTTGDYSGIPA